VGKYRTAGQATGDNMARAFCIMKKGKNTDIYSEYVILIAFPQQQLAKASQFYVMPTFPVLL
jgi:hypothetical protein